MSTELGPVDPSAERPGVAARVLEGRWLENRSTPVAGSAHLRRLPFERDTHPRGQRARPPPHRLPPHPRADPREVAADPGGRAGRGGRRAGGVRATASIPAGFHARRRRARARRVGLPDDDAPGPRRPPREEAARRLRRRRRTAVRRAARRGRRREEGDPGAQRHDAPRGARGRGLLSRRRTVAAGGRGAARGLRADVEAATRALRRTDARAAQ
jgi:hypothetical protein